MADKYERLTSSVRITANKPLTKRQWEVIHEKLAQSFEDTIAESESLTAQIGHVHLGSPWSDGIEICV